MTLRGFMLLMALLLLVVSYLLTIWRRLADAQPGFFFCQGGFGSLDCGHLTCLLHGLLPFSIALWLMAFCGYMAQWAHANTSVG